MSTNPKTLHAHPYLVHVAVHPTPDGATVLVTPNGDQYHVGADPHRVAAFLQSCNGQTPIADLVATSPDPEGFAAILDVLLEIGCLQVTPPPCDAAHWLRFADSRIAPERIAATHLLLLGDTQLVTLPYITLVTAPFASTMVVSWENLEAHLMRQRKQSVFVVVLNAYLDAPRLLDLDRLCAQYRTPWTQLHFDVQGKGRLGPLVAPGCAVSYADVLTRRRCAVDDDDIFLALLSPPIGFPNHFLPDETIAWTFGILFSEIGRWVVGAPCRLLSTEMEIDPASLSVCLHPVLPLPDRRFDLPFRAIWQGNSDALVDERTGVVLRFRTTQHHSSIPTRLRTVQADLANMMLAERIPWQNDLLSGGSVFDDEAAARQAALGEAVERYCGNYIGVLPMIQASYCEIAASGERALDPESLVLFSDKQYADPDFPFVRFTHDLRVRWVLGRSLTRDEPVWLPASWVYINWHVGDFAQEPVTHFHQYAGIQAGPSLEFALASGIEEVIERDAMMTWWMNAHPLPALHIPPDLAAIWQGEPTVQGQRAWIIYLENEFAVPVMAGVVEHLPEQLINIGFAARPDAVWAAKKSWAEALILQDGSRDLNQPDDVCATRQLLHMHAGSGDYLKPWRDDRHYIDSYRSDFHDVVQLLAQQQICLDPRARAVFHSWVDVPATRPFAEAPQLPDRSVATYRNLVERHGYEIFYADLTTPDVALCGMHVVRVMIPGLAPNFPAAFPALGRERIQRHAVKLGWRDTPRTEQELNYFPLPYA
jgi:ribosomal protein S12 methylthiotransferase accessory factor